MNSNTEKSVSIFCSVYQGHSSPPRVCFVFCLLVVGLFYLAATTPASAATYYCDPVNGNTTTGDGSVGSPWGTFESIFTTKIQRRSTYNGEIANPGLPVAEGDTVILKDGYHGKIVYSNWHSNGGVMDIRAAANETPVIGYLQIKDFAHWSFTGITFKPEDANAAGDAWPTNCVWIRNQSADANQQSHDITFDDCHALTADYATSDDWNDAKWTADGAGGIIISGGTADMTVQNCLIENVNGGIAARGDSQLITGNTIQEWVGDGITVGWGDNSVVSYNTLQNFRKRLDATHSDAIVIDQDVSRTNLIVRGNKIIGHTSQDSLRTFPESQGLKGVWSSGDAVPDNWLIENNLIVLNKGSTSSAMTFSAGGTMTIVNNTCVSATDWNTGTPTINITGGVITAVKIRNNITMAAITTNANITASNNTLATYADLANLLDNYNSYNYSVKVGSALIDAGTTTDAPTIDIDQEDRDANPDAGCYEYISSGSDNSAPVLGSIGNKTINENSSLSFSVSATDADSDTITYSATGTAIDAGATLSGQSFSWTPGYSQAGSYEVTFTASDGTASDSETITITVSNTNRTPVLASIGDKSVDENSTLSFTVSATDADDDTVTYSATGLPSGATLGSSSGDFTWTPGYTQAGSHQVTFIATAGGETDSEQISITVNNVNRAPVLSVIGDKLVFTENSLAFAVSATDADSDTITYSATGLPSGATFSGQNFSWTPGSGQAGSYDVTFTASDNQAQDSEVITITVTADSSAPTVTNLSPAADSVQTPLNSLIYLDITDSGKGVNASTVTIEVNSNLVYIGNTTDHNSSYGRCRRIGTIAAYKYIYQADETFDYGQTVTVTVNATDLAGNSMDEYSYSFKTEMRSFGENKKVNSGSNTLNENSPATASDSSGNTWAVWHTGQTGSRDIYIGKLTAGTDSFGNSVRVINNNTDQCNPTIAIDSTDKLYVAWQDYRNGEWDIYVSTSTDGTTWTTERKITDPNSNQINPAIAIDSTNKTYIVWEDDSNNNQDIYIASSSNSFVSYATSQITSNASDQITPAVAIDSSNTVYVVWTDVRGGTNDIYGADSDNGPWTNVTIVNNANNQSSPTIATEASGTILHLLWVDDTSGDNDIYYALANGLPGSSLTGSSLVDDTSSAVQSAPAIIVTSSTGNSLKVFACWKDERNVSSGNGDTDIYFVEVNSDSETNVLVGDDSINSAQSSPAMGIDGYGYPYMVWTDGRSTGTDIYYAGSTFAGSTALESEDVTASSGVTVGTELANINSTTDVSVIIPVGASSHDATITISRVKNPQKLTLDNFSTLYEFGPSGIEFDQPVTIIIPYDVSTMDNSPSAYWYNLLTDVLSQQGITNVEIIEISSTLHALRFKTTHFTQFLVGGGIAAAVGGGGGGGGGGCSISPNGQGSIVDFLLPYIGLAVAMTIVKLQNKRKKKMHDIVKS